VDVGGEPLVESPFELKHRKRTYDSIVSEDFKSFWARVEDHAAKRKAVKNPVKDTVGEIQRMLNGLVLDALLLHRAAEE
jgi:predicted KAP-like P-loop ATPase